jgi:hypothetical protein
MPLTFDILFLIFVPALEGEGRVRVKKIIQYL